MRRAVLLLLLLLALTACAGETFLTPSPSPTTTAVEVVGSAEPPSALSPPEADPTTTIPEPGPVSAPPAEQSGDGEVQRPPSVAPPSLAGSGRSTTTTIPASSIANGPLPVNLGGDVWGRLAMCESGGDPAKNTGNGYYGAFQFAASTWWDIGETGYAHQFPYEHQRAAAQRLQARSGWGQWPSCARQLGLL